MTISMTMSQPSIKSIEKGECHRRPSAQDAKSWHLADSRACVTCRLISEDEMEDEIDDALNHYYDAAYASDYEGPGVSNRPGRGLGLGAPAAAPPPPGPASCSNGTCSADSAYDDDYYYDEPADKTYMYDNCIVDSKGRPKVNGEPAQQQAPVKRYTTACEHAPCMLHHFMLVHSIHGALACLVTLQQRSPSTSAAAGMPAVPTAPS
jgi:hypothetical protein